MGQAAMPLAILGSAGLGGLGSIFAPEGQELSSFETGAQGNELDPRTMAAGVKRGLGDYLGLALNEARQPVTSNTTVAPLPSFSGGGLPFDISAPAVDPNRLDASRRTLPGLNIPMPFGQELIPPADPRSRGFPRGGGPYDPPTDEDGNPLGPPPGSKWDPDLGHWVPDAGSSEGSSPARRTLDTGYAGGPDDIPTLGQPEEGVSVGYDPGQFGAGDLSDLDQAEGAIALLLKQLGQA